MKKTLLRVSLRDENGGNADTLIQKYGNLEKAIRSGAVSADLLKKSIGGISVGVSFSQSHDQLTIPVTLTVTRVEGGK